MDEYIKAVMARLTLTRGIITRIGQVAEPFGRADQMIFCTMHAVSFLD
jgi:hypothetical protein